MESKYKMYFVEFCYTQVNEITNEGVKLSINSTTAIGSTKAHCCGGIEIVSCNIEISALHRLVVQSIVVW